MKHIFTISLCFLALSLSAYGQNNYSMSFDGVDDYVNIGTPIQLTENNDATISIWMNSNTYGATSLDEIFDVLITNDTEPTNSEFILGVNQQGYIYIQTGDGGASGSTIDYNSSLNVLDGFWHNIVVTKKPISNTITSELVVYLDGINVKIDTVSGNWQSSISDSFFIGVERINGHRSYLGLIDDVAIFDYTLDHQEIQSYMSCPPTGNESGLVGYWNFEEGSGTSAADQTSNGNDGTIYGATYSSDVPTPNTSYTDITACDSYDWNGNTYTESGSYSYSGGVSNNYSMSFDGDDDFINLGTNLIQSYPFTITADIFINNLSVNNIILSQHNTWCWYIRNPGGGEMQLEMWNQYGGSARFDYTFNENEWYSISFKVDENNNVSSRVNTEIIPLIENSMNPLTLNTNVNVHLGYWALDNESFNGEIDNLQIWDIALSETEVQQYMNCPPTGSEEGLVGYWSFEEGQGTTASDQTPNGNVGTINEATFSTNVHFPSCGLTTENGCDSTAVLNLTMLPCDAVSTFCGEGTVWDSETQECIVANPTDTNFDGCTDLNDLLDILSSYGDCAVSETNYSLSFDGVDDYVDLGNSYDFDFSNSPLSIMCWVNINNNSWIDGIVSKCTSSNLGWWLGTVSNDPTWANPNTFTFSGSESSGNYFSTNSPIILNDWVFLSTMYINGEQKLYINGILVDQSSHQYNLYNSATNLLIGKKTGDNNYDGLMDNLSIWNSALTQEQIQSYMSTPPTGNEEGLVGYWDFNEGTGSTLTDQTSNGNDGVINGATWSTDVPTAP